MQLTWWKGKILKLIYNLISDSKLDHSSDCKSISCHKMAVLHKDALLWLHLRFQPTDLSFTHKGVKQQQIIWSKAFRTLLLQMHHLFSYLSQIYLFLLQKQRSCAWVVFREVSESCCISWGIIWGQTAAKRNCPKQGYCSPEATEKLLDSSLFSCICHKKSRLACISPLKK